MCNRSDALYTSVLTDIEICRKAKGMTFSADKVPSDCDDSQEAAHVSLVQSITKKWLPVSGDRRLREEAIKLFLSNNERCIPKVVNGELLATMRYLAFRELPSIEWSQLLGRMRFGPGASVGSHGRNSFFEKFFVNPLTTTDPALYTEYRSFMRRRTTWLASELARIRIQGGDPIRLVAGSNLSTVPKTARIDRTICTEPSLNMLFQLCLGDAFNDALSKHYGYDPALQPDRNREMARLGSSGGSACTIDLKSASDTISLSLCESVLPSDWFAAILDCRSPATLIDGSRQDLHMVSSMGNGFTFPLQTYIFSLMIKAICHIHSVKFDRYNKTNCYGVFGDDIVVPATLYDRTIESLLMLGFQPNSEKSFGTGSFRESCGTDWFDGVNVRGVYARKLQNLPDRFSLINRLIRWSTIHRTPLCHTISGLLPQNSSSFYVPSDTDDTAGIKVPFFMHGKPFYKEFSVKRRVFHILGNHGKLRPGWDNSLGVVLAASAGAFQSGGLDRRQDPTRYVRVNSFTPCWDSPVDLNRYGIGFADWEKTTWISLTS